MTIRKERRTNLTMDIIEFIAVDEEGRDILGASAKVRRYKNVEDFAKLGEKASFNNWFISFGCCGAGTYQEKLPFVAVINKAMEFLRKQEEEVR